MIARRYVIRSFSSLIKFDFWTKRQQSESLTLRLLPASYQVWLAVLPVMLVAFVIRGYCVFGWSYPSGADYGQVVLQADLLLSNDHLPETVPYFQLGKTNWVTMPGAALLYAFMADLSGSSVLDIIPISLITALIEVAGVYLLAWRIFGRLDAAVVTAAVTAVLPLAPDMMAWAGYPNLIVLALIPFVFVAWLDYWEHPDRRRLVLLVLLLCGTMSIHHVSTLWIGLSLGLFALVFLIVQPAASFRKLLPLGIAGLVVGLPVVWRVIDLTFSTRATDVLAGTGNRFDPTRIDWKTWARLAEPISIVLLVGGFVYFLRLQIVQAPAKVLLACYVLVSLIFSFGWLLKIDFYYTRGLFFLSIPIAFGAASLVFYFRHVPLRAVMTVALVLFLGTTSMMRSREVAQYYQALTPEFVDAIDWLNDYSQPDDVLVVGTFSGFHMAHLTPRPVMVGLTPDLVGNPEELSIAQDAVSVLMGLHNMDEVIDERHVRFVLVKSAFDIPDPFRTQLAMNANPRLELVFDNSKIQIYEVVN